MNEEVATLYFIVRLYRYRVVFEMQSGSYECAFYQHPPTMHCEVFKGNVKGNAGIPAAAGYQALIFALGLRSQKKNDQTEARSQDLVRILAVKDT